MKIHILGLILLMTATLSSYAQPHGTITTATNPFMVTEEYIKENGKWKMGSLTFSHLMRPVKMNK